MDSALLIKGEAFLKSFKWPFRNSILEFCRLFMVCLISTVFQGGNKFLESGPEHDGTEKHINEISTRKRGEHLLKQALSIPFALL